MTGMNGPLWTPDPIFAASTNMAHFTRFANERRGAGADSPRALWRWSIREPEAFWNAVWDFCGVIGDRGERAVVDFDRLPGARWYPDARLNYAENLLLRRDDTPALMFRAEDRVRRDLTWAQLYDTTSRLAQALGALGLGPGDRVAGYVPNLPESIVYMLASASLGATISTASPDFGAQGVFDRFGQVEPRVLLAADGYFWQGRRYSSLDRLPEIVRRLPSVERVIIIPHTDPEPDISAVPRAVLFNDFIAPCEAGEIEFRRLPFDHPLYILFSSGTTGVPKCIVHTAGGVLLTHLKEHQLHADVRRGDRTFYFTTCGWMMWNWLSSALASEATVVLFDGSPFHPGPEVLFDYADEVRMTQLGVSAKFIDAIGKEGLRPRETHDLSSVRTMVSTGSPLVPEGFDYVYRHVKSDVHLASISGGTDLCGGFVVGHPLLPVWRGEIQAPALGMDVDVWDEKGRSMPVGKGELVCKSPFPSVPAGFWGDEDGRRFHEAYFDVYPGVWRHGDWMEWTEHGGVVIYGRSDATLNAGGVRIGTAEIYRLVDRLPEVMESIVIGQPWENDTRVILFVRLADGRRLDEELEARIKTEIRENASPRHVPARILEVSDIPRTKSAKISELAVRAVVMGEPVKNSDALANPEALEEYRDRPELRT
ncbi:acetoacetate--CoA ligase [Candidatus Palauibacter sp.]|uniref:acetoacetate--CoA ligase n=1 Tax=Candidatus Palauibacter sp. TaxID=3101350 RepID=UPI003B02BD6B